MSQPRPEIAEVRDPLGLKILTGVMVLVTLVTALGLGIFQHRERHLGSPALEARMMARNQALSGALDDLALHLEDLDGRIEMAGNVAFEAREILGLEHDLTVAPAPRLYRHPELESSLDDELTFAAARTENALREVRRIKGSMAGIVDRMEADAAAWACVPSTRPLEGARLTSSYGRRRDPFTGRLAWHRGLDLSAAVGTPVLASAEGRVIRAGYYGSYGYLVEMDHGNGLRTRYAHNSRLAVHVGQRVRRGEVLSYVGASGRASAPHLHYEVLLHGEPVNPEPYILPDFLTAE